MATASPNRESGRGRGVRQGSARNGDVFGAALKYHRKRARLTQDELGRAVGYSRQYISLLESGRRLPDVTTLAALFVPALRLTQDPASAQRLLELAATTGRTTLTAQHVTVHAEPPPADSIPNDTLAKAFGWYIQMDPESALHLANAMSGQWRARGQYAEARAWLRQILSCSTSETVSRAHALLRAADFAQQQGDAHEALALALQAQASFERRNDPIGVAHSLHAQGWARYDLHERTAASDCFERCAALARKHEAHNVGASALLGLVHLEQLLRAPSPAQLEREQALLAECAALSERIADNGYVAANIARERAFAALCAGDAVAAIAFARDAEARLSVIGDITGLAWARAILGESLYSAQTYEEAQARYEQARATFLRTENAAGAGICEFHLARIALRQGRITTARDGFEAALRRHIDGGNRFMQARCQSGLAETALALGDRATAEAAFAAAAIELQAPSVRQTSFDRAEFEALARALQAAPR